MKETGHVALVTGAASGIGQAAAVRLSASGAAIVLVDVNAEGLAQTDAVIRAAGGKAVVVVEDCARPARPNALWRRRWRHSAGSMR